MNQHTQLLKKHGKSFYWAGVFLGKKQLYAAKRLYGFCRYIDDKVDENPNIEEAKQIITQIKQEIESGKSDNLIVSDMLAFMSEYRVQPKIVLDLIDGVTWDLDHHYIETEAALFRYSYRVAGTVGLLMCAIFRVKAPQALAYAVDLGIAMQLTNIARDIKEDALRGRVYLPQTWFANRLTPTAILTGEYNNLVYEKLVKLLSIADNYYRSADYGMAYLFKRARLSILMASRLYEAIGLKCLKLGCDDYWQTDRVSTTKLKKITLSLKTIWELASTRMYYQKKRPHQTQLHAALQNLFIYGPF